MKHRRSSVANRSRAMKSIRLWTVKKVPGANVKILSHSLALEEKQNLVHAMVSRHAQLITVP